MKEKIENLIKKLNIGLIEREEQIKIALLAVISGENILFVGPPGTGKSQLTRRIAKVFKNTDYFEYLLTKFTTPEELFGPISIKELENDKFHRNTESYLTDSDIVFLDEVFKANSAILNSLLTIMNEKIYHNGYQRETIKTKSILGATNELPKDEYELDALYDRFLFREKIDYIKNTKALMFLSEDEPSFKEEEKIDIQDFSKFYDNLDEVILSDDIAEKILKIKNKIFVELGETISDRRLVKVIKILKVSALTSNRKKINVFDLLLLNYLFWTKGENINFIKKIIKNEILDIEAIDTGELEYLHKKWSTHFNDFFKEQKKNENGEVLFYDINKKMTTNKKGLLHVRDAMGNYLFYKGHRDYVKVSNELGKFDHGYIDSGLKTLDKKNVWIYEFSPIEVISDFNEYVENFEKLTIEGNLEPVNILSFSEYFDIYGATKLELIPLFKEIENNLNYEYKKINEIYTQLFNKKKYLNSQKEDIMWIPIEELIEINTTIDNKVIEITILLERLKNLIFDVNKATYG